MSEQDDLKAYQRGEAAKRILDSELYQQAWDDVKAAIVKEWEASPQRDVEGRERLHMMLSCLKMSRKHIESHMQTGKVAAKRLSDLEARRTLRIFNNS